MVVRSRNGGLFSVQLVYYSAMSVVVCRQRGMDSVAWYVVDVHDICMMFAIHEYICARDEFQYSARREAHKAPATESLQAMPFLPAFVVRGVFRHPGRYPREQHLERAAVLKNLY